jgi:hypothetical protein
MIELKEKLLIAHIQRLTALINQGLDECLIDDDGLVSALDEEIELGSLLLKGEL